jgi:cytochrome c
MRIGICLAFVAGLAGCSERDQPNAEDAASVSEQPAAAPAPVEIAAATFDTVVWANDSTAIARGADVFKWACARCHGATGRGDGGAVVAGDTIHPPSFLESDWRFANDSAGLHRKIYQGNNRGMPHWGDIGLQARDVVALGHYIRKSMRPQRRGD